MYFDEGRADGGVYCMDGVECGLGFCKRAAKEDDLRGRGAHQGESCFGAQAARCGAG